MRARALLIALLLPLAGALPAQAADPTYSPLSQLGTPGYPAPTLIGTLELSLADAVSLGIENNLGVEIQRHEPLIAHTDYRTAWGAYDPLWSAEIGYADIEDPTGSLLAGSEVSGATVIKSTTFDGRGGFSGLVPWLGASYRMELVSSDVRTTFAVQNLSPELRSEVNFALTVPLMKGLIWNEPWTAVKTTHVLEGTAWEAFRRDLMDTVQAIEDGYWAVVADAERVEVAEKSLETAQALLSQVETQYEVGVVSKVEVIEAEAGVAQRDSELIRAENRYANTMDVLIDLILGPNLTADSRIQIQPTDLPDQVVPYEVDVERAAQIALVSRPELSIAEREIERLEFQLKFAKNQRLPQLDAVLSYGNRGIAGFESAQCGTGGLGDPDCGDIGGYGKTYNTPGAFFTGDAARQLSARAILTIPIPNTQGRQRVSRAELELRRARVARRRVQQDIILEIREAARTLRASQEDIEAADRARVAAQEQLRAERIRLEYGESTPFDVLLRERDLVSAEQEYIFALQVFRTSITALDRRQGTILRNRNIRVEEAARLR